MVKELIFSQIAISIQANIRMVNLRVKANTLGRMAHSTSENSETVLNMAREGGKVAKVLNVTNMKETIVTIKSMAMGFSNGQAVIHIKANTKKMKEMATEK